MREFYLLHYYRLTRFLSILSHAIDTARREWDVFLPANPCTLVRRPPQELGARIVAWNGEYHEMHQPDVAGVAARREQLLLLVALQAPVTRAADASVFCHSRSRDGRSTYPTTGASDSEAGLGRAA